MEPQGWRNELGENRQRRARRRGFSMRVLLVEDEPEMVAGLRAALARHDMRDEPLGALDEARKLEILPYLVRLRDEANVPMVYVSHDVAELRQLATQIVMLKQGRVTSFGGVKVLT
jgi:molybdate transport system ATP-binding protein